MLVILWKKAYVHVTQFAYRSGENSMHRCFVKHATCYVYLYLNDPNYCLAVSLFTMDLAKAFDSINHKLKCLPLNPYIINWYFSFLENQKQRVAYTDFVEEWKNVNRCIVQGSVSGLYLFNIFINDLELEIDIV